MRPVGVQPSVGSPHRRVVRAGAAGVLRPVLGVAYRLETQPGPGVFVRGVQRAAATGLRHLQGAFAAFWDKRSCYPRFKSRKRSRACAEYTRSGFRWRDGQLTLAKMTDPLDIRWSRPLPDGAVPSTVTVSRDGAGRWFVSILVETTVKALAPVDATVGVDAGITSLLTLSTGEKIVNPRHERRDRARLAKAQCNLARKQKGSANRNKARRRLARVHARIGDRRRDHLHKLSTRLVRENQTVVIERFYPSSKVCSDCGALQDTMPLGVREWSCPCGAVHDRDINAAINIKAAGLAVQACGDGVRPARAQARAGNCR